MVLLRLFVPKKERPSRFLLTALIYVGNDLLFHRLSRAVQSDFENLPPHNARARDSGYNRYLV